MPNTSPSSLSGGSTRGRPGPGDGSADQPVHQPCRRAARQHLVRRRRADSGRPVPTSTKIGSSALARRCGLQQMAGALEKILEQSVQYALDRTQFGRPIAKFQAVQHNLATLAGEVAAAGAAADAAAEACAAPEIGDRRGRDRQGARRRGGRDRRGDRPSGARRDGLYLRALAAPCDAPALGLARGVRQRGGLGRAPWAMVAARGADAAVALHHPGIVRTDTRGRDEFQFSFRPGRPAARGQGVAPGGPGLSARGDRGRDVLAAWRQGLVLARVQPQGRRQGLDRHDLAQEIRRARALASRALCRDRGDAGRTAPRPARIRPPTGRAARSSCATARRR